MGWETGTMTVNTQGYRDGVDSSFINTIPDGWRDFNKSVFFDALDYAVDGVVLDEIQDEILKYEL